MKKLLLILLAAVMLMFVGCSKTETDNGESTEPFISAYSHLKYDMLINPYVVNSGKHFEVYKTASEDMEKQYYWYRIYDKNKNVISEGGTEWKEPIITESGNIVSVSVSMGTLSSYWRFCNAETGGVSEEFVNIICQKNELACRFDPNKNKLVVFNVFDNSENISEITADFAKQAEPVFDAEFFSDNTIRFSYYNANNEEKTSEVYF